MKSPTDLQFEDIAGCLIVRVKGRGMVEEKEASIKAIADAAVARSSRAVLVDLRGITGPLSFMDRYQIGELTGRYLAGVNLAALALEEQTDKQRIGQLVALNRGARVQEIFLDEGAAYSWLKKYAVTEEK